jgi:3',5'-cyclic AMP phosphodiesterase CpdA
VIVAQLTDTHVVADPSLHEMHVDNNERLRLAVAALNAETPAPDLVLLTGDLVNTGADDEYEVLAPLIEALEIPVLAIPGNHDTRHGIQAVFPDLPWAGGDHASCFIDLDDPDVGPMRWIGLDSTLPGVPGAEFDAAREEWLVAAIKEATGRVALALHHPPFATGIVWMDDAGFIGLDRLVAVLEKHPVERIVSGHIHRALTAMVAGIPAVTCPSTIHHVDLDLDPSAPISLIVDPPAYFLHQITANGWVTHQRFFANEAERIHPAWAD